MLEPAQRLLGGLRCFPDAVCAFADHWVLRDEQRDPAESDRVSAFWGRAGLRAGLHIPFQRLALIDQAVPIAIAALFRRDAVLAEPIPAEVGGAYDLFLAYVLCRHGAGAVYVDRRLSSWRVHAGNLTHIPSPARAQENAAVLRVMIDDRSLAGLRAELSQRYAEALWTVAVRNLLAGSDRRALAASCTALRLGHQRAWLLLAGLLVPRPLRRELARQRGSRATASRSGRSRDSVTRGPVA